MPGGIQTAKVSPAAVGRDDLAATAAPATFPPNETLHM
jgi:hypothetical protein